MAMRVKKLAGQGAQNIGAFTADKVQPANTPFQTMKAPLLTSNAGKGLAQFGKQASAAVDDFVAEMTRKKKEDETIQLLEDQEKGNEEERQIREETLSKFEGNAIGTAQKARERAQKFVDNLPSDEGMTGAGRIARKRWANGLIKSVSTTADKHERGEKKKYIVRMANTSIATAQERGIDSYTSDEEMTKQAGLIAQRAKTVAELTTVAGSKGANILAERLRSENVSKMYAGAIDRALSNKDTARANALLAQAKASNSLDSNNGDLARAEAAVAMKTTEAFAVEKTNEIITQHPEDLEGALKAARTAAGGDPDKEKALVTEVKNRFGEREKIRTLDLRKKKVDAVALARQGKYDEIPAGVVAELGGPMATALEGMSARAKRGAAVSSDPTVYNKFNNMTPEQLEDEIMTPEALTKLSDRDWQKFSDRQAKASPADKTAQQTRTQIVTGALKSAGITDDTMVYGFNQSLDIAIRHIEEGKGGKKASSEEIRKATDLLLIDGEYVGGPNRPDPDIRAFELKEGQVFLIDDYGDIPQKEIDAIRNDPAAKAANLSNDQVLAIYNASLNARIKKAKGFK